MSKQLQLRGGTTTEHSTFTGAAREVTVDTTKDTLVVHDGATAGGVPLATEAYADAAAQAVVDAAPAALDTLNELAAALNDDANFSTTVTNSLATKLPLAGGTMTGDITFNATQTFDGRDVSADGTKLDGIESGATADQTAQEIATAIDADATAEATLKSALGLGTAAYTASTAYATAAQGSNADTAYGWGDHSTQNYAATTGDTMTGALNFGDSVNANFGASNDLQIYHNGSSSYIRDAGTGNLNILGDEVNILNSGGTENKATLTSNGAVTLYYDNSSKFATSSTGVDITGEITTDDLTATGAVKVQQIKEKITVSATAATGTINLDALTQQVLYYTTDATANFTLNIRGDGSNTLNSIMATGESLTMVFMCTNGATAYYGSAFQVDGSSVTPKWQGGSAPSEGTASSIDSYSLTVVKTADATFTVFASLTAFA